MADHKPYGEAAGELGEALGVEMGGGFILGPDQANPGTITFDKAGKSLATHEITQGVGEGRAVDSVVTFTGQALRGGDGYTPILTFPKGVSYRSGRGPKSASVDGPNIEGWHQGLVGRIGKGRVAVFGEAGMFSAQLSRGDRKMGMNAEGAEENQQFLLNLIHWLNH